MKRRQSDTDARFLLVIVTIVCLMLLAMLFSGCTTRQGYTADNIISESIWSRPATPTECATGGVAVIVLDTINVVCNGASGAPGATGANAPAVAVINVCPGQTIYPTTFVETALCINGTLYGVYSDRGGFLTTLQPGQYVSNAINSVCNFTVLPNCQIQH